jgi:galactose mutarotase-like enzyme
MTTLPDWITIERGTFAAAINPLGAELSSLTDAAGREWMTDADPAFWSGRAPLLFPIVGALNGGCYRLDGVEYAMPQHGFARRRAFDLVDRSEHHARFRLRDDAQTRAVYPFAFTLDADYRLTADGLTIACTVANPGDAPLPFSFGYHPAFAWPLPGERDRDGHVLRFEAPEPAPLVALADGLIADTPRASPLEPDRRTLALNDAQFAADALIWRGLESRAVDYLGPNGARLRVAFPDCDTLGVWTKPGAAFLCIEPWWGHADPAGFDGDFRAKPGATLLAPGESRTFTMQVSISG